MLQKPAGFSAKMASVPLEKIYCKSNQLWYNHAIVVTGAGSGGLRFLQRVMRFQADRHPVLMFRIVWRLHHP